MSDGGFQLFIVRMVGTKDIVGIFAAKDEAHLEHQIDECTDAVVTEYREIDAFGVYWEGPAFAIPNGVDTIEYALRDASLTDAAFDELMEDGEWTTFKGGVVYLLEANGRYKIGFSANVPNRIRDLQTSCPYPLRLVAVVPGTVETEKRIHAQFKAYRKIGEWFDLPQHEVDLMRGMGLPVPDKEQDD